MSLPVVTHAEMEAARKILAGGGNLQQAADALGIERGEMDLLLWNRGGRLVGAGKCPPIIQLAGTPLWLVA